MKGNEEERERKMKDKTGKEEWKGKRRRNKQKLLAQINGKMSSYRFYLLVYFQRISQMSSRCRSPTSKDPPSPLRLLLTLFTIALAPIPS